MNRLNPTIVPASELNAGEAQSVLEDILLDFRSDWNLGEVGITLDNGEVLFGSASGVRPDGALRFHVPIRVPIRFSEAKQGRLSLRFEGKGLEDLDVQVALRLAFVQDGRRQIDWETTTAGHGCNRIDLVWGNTEL